MPDTTLGGKGWCDACGGAWWLAPGQAEAFVATPPTSCPNGCEARMRFEPYDLAAEIHVMIVEAAVPNPDLAKLAIAQAVAAHEAKGAPDKAHEAEEAGIAAFRAAMTERAARDVAPTPPQTPLEERIKTLDAKIGEV